MITKLEEQILLTVGKFKNEAYGINVYQHLESITGEKVAVGVIYFAMDRLAKKDFLKSYKGEPTAVRGGMRKKYYKLTDHGLEALSKAKKVNDSLWQEYKNLAVTKK